MKIVEQSFEILFPAPLGTKDYLADAFVREAKLIELAGRTTDKSEEDITRDSYDKFIRSLIKRGREGAVEFGSMAVRLITTRGVSHEFVKHRMCSFTQESTGRCNYDEDQFGRELTVIKPSTWASWSGSQRKWWEESLKYAELNYLLMVQDDMEPQDAHSVLPNSLKTELVAKTNFREWRRIFRIDAISKAAHPDMRALMIPLYKKCRKVLPCVFDMGEPEEQNNE
jgi:thymidylate synthase (FAD)